MSKYNGNKVAIVIEALVREDYLQYIDTKIQMTPKGITKVLDLMSLAFMDSDEFKDAIKNNTPMEDAEVRYAHRVMEQTTGIHILIANYGYDILTE